LTFFAINSICSNLDGLTVKEIFSKYKDIIKNRNKKNTSFLKKYREYLIKNNLYSTYLHIK